MIRDDRSAGEHGNIGNRQRDYDRRRGLQYKHSARREMRTTETILFKLAGVSTVVMLKCDCGSALRWRKCLRLARLGRADVEQHERHHEQRYESEPAGQHATGIDDTCSATISPLGHRGMRLMDESEATLSRSHRKMNDRRTSSRKDWCCPSGKDFR